jgi:hypothetical protein
MFRRRKSKWDRPWRLDYQTKIVSARVARAKGRARDEEAKPEDPEVVLGALV